MKYSRSEIRRKFHALPLLRFEEQSLTSFAGLVLFQALFEQLDLKNRLRQCVQHLSTTPIFEPWRIFLLLLVHQLLGFRELRQVRFYQDDPMVLRLLGLEQLPNVATISRHLARIDATSVCQFQRLIGSMVFERLIEQKLSRVTLDFDGSVIGTGRYAEGAAVGFNRKKKGQRSYYPLFCTVAQTGQVLDVLHRSGNVHDSNGAETFILACIRQMRDALPQVQIEIRMDSAFFSDEIVSALDEAGVEYTISVPFERLAELKARTEQGGDRWLRVNNDTDAFDEFWKPKSWKRFHRFLFVRQANRIQSKEPIQLGLFVPYEFGYDFKVILTNKALPFRRLIDYHNGRGSQEGLFAELKTDNQLDYIPCNTWLGNRTYLLAVIMAHNLSRELQMRSRPQQRTTLAKRPALWAFEKLGTLRRTLIQQAGRLIRPQGRLTLSMASNEATAKQMLRVLDALQNAA